LHKLGFWQYRVRHHGTLCRIEIDERDFEKVLRKDIRDMILSEIKQIGYQQVTLDLKAYSR